MHKLDPTECQDGIGGTHNCTHVCTRNVSDGMSSYNCSCKAGYVQNENDTNLCDGEFDVQYIAIIFLQIITNFSNV